MDSRRTFLSTVFMTCMIALSMGFAFSSPCDGAQPEDASARPTVFSFDRGTHGFQALSGHLAAVQEPGAFVEGTGGLRYEYTLGPDTFTFITLDGKALRGRGHLRFWVRTEGAAFLLVSVEERDGSRYISTVCTRSLEWHHVCLDLSELALGDETEDENDTLDLDEVSSLSVGDITAAAAERFRLVGYPKSAQRTLWLDEMVFSATPLPCRTPEGGRAVLDDFEGELTGWLVSEKRHGTLEIVDGSDVGAAGQCLCFAYNMKPRRFVGAVKVGLNLAGADVICLRLKAERPSLVSISLGEADHSSYNHALNLPADEWVSKEVPFDAFALGDDSA